MSFPFFSLFILKHISMTKEEIQRAEQIRAEIRRTLNKMLDEEYAAILKEAEEGNILLSIEERDRLMSASKGLKEGSENSNPEAMQERG